MSEETKKKTNRGFNRAKGASGYHALEFTDRERRIIINLFKAGWTNGMIANLVGHDQETITKHFPEFKDIGELGVEKLIQVGSSIYNAALAGDMTAAIWYEKTRGRMKIYAPMKCEEEGEEGNKQPITVNVFGKPIEEA